MPKIVTKRMQFVFWVLILWRKKVSRSKPRPSSSFKSAWKSRSPQSLVLFFCCFSLFFARFFCMHFHVIDSPLPLLRVSSARPHLSLYSVTYSIQGESSYHLSEIFQTGLSLLICVCGAGTPQYCDLPSLFCLPQSFLGQTFCTLGEIIGSSGSRLSGCFRKSLIIFHPWYDAEEETVPWKQFFKSSPNPMGSLFRPQI